MELEFWGWDRFRKHGAWISDRLYDFLADRIYHEKTQIPAGIIFSCLERSYLENWGIRNNE